MCSKTQETYQREFTNFAMSKSTTIPLKTTSQIESINHAAPKIQMVKHNERGDLTFERRIRTEFTNSQVLELEREFKKTPYLQGSRRIEISTRLGLSEQQVKVWFQNRRVKWKRKPTTSNNMMVKSISVDRSMILEPTIQSENANPNNSQELPPFSHPQVSMEKLPVIRPLKAQIVQSQLPMEVLNTVATKTVKTFKPQVLVKIPVVTTTISGNYGSRKVDVSKNPIRREPVLPTRSSLKAQQSLLKPRIKTASSQIISKSNERFQQNKQEDTKQISLSATSTNDELYTDLYSDLLTTLDKLVDQEDECQKLPELSLDMEEFLVFPKHKETRAEDKNNLPHSCSSSNTIDSTEPKTEDDTCCSKTTELRPLSPIVTLSFDDIFDL